MKTTHVWVRNRVTGGTWQCPVAVLDEMAKKGWERCEPPPQHDPTTADALAWRAQQQEEQQKTAAPRAARPSKGVSSDDRQSR